MYDMFARSLELALAVWAATILGSLLLLIASGAGWALARQSSSPLVRLVAWWIRNVVIPVVTCREWWRRAAAIFANNAAVLAALLTTGRWPVAPLLAISAVGVSLGIALRVMSDLPPPSLALPPSRRSAAKHRIRVGVALNLLEPPAIILTVGLTLARSGMSLPGPRAWEAFSLLVVPATLLAAAGEALWLGAFVEQRNALQHGQELEDINTEP